VINTLLSSSRFILKVVTQDWHPATHVSFAPNHPAPDNKAFESYVDVHNIVGGRPGETMKQRLWPIHCVQGTGGAELVEGLDVSKVDITVKKGQDAKVEMYSAFSDSFGNLTYGSGGVDVDLTKEMSQRQITHAYVVGLAGDYCVKDTALSSARAGFITYLVEEAQRCTDASVWPEVQKTLAQGNVRVVRMDGDEVKRVLDA
jgi:nicotinamidase-related amidase